MKINFIIPGPPQGKARPKVTRTKNGFSHTYTPDKTVAYEELVRQRFRQAWKQQGIPFPGTIPVRVIITAYFQPPKSAGQTKRADMLAGICKPTKRPDVDNIIKIVLDALNGFAWHDDAQVTTVYVLKTYTDDEPHVKVSLSADQDLPY